MYLDKILNLYIDNDMTMMQSFVLRMWKEYRMHTFSSIKMTHFYSLSFFPPLSLSLVFFLLLLLLLSFWPEGFDWQTHIQSRKENEGIEKRLLWLYPAREMSTSHWWLTISLSHLFLSESLINKYTADERKKRRKFQDEEVIKNYELLWKLLLIVII